MWAIQMPSNGTYLKGPIMNDTLIFEDYDEAVEVKSETILPENLEFWAVVKYEEVQK